MAKTESGKSSKTSERRSPKKKEGSPALQAKDEGSEESKFNPRMREAYLQKVVPALMKEFGYKNIMQVPKLPHVPSAPQVRLRVPQLPHAAFSTAAGAQPLHPWLTQAVVQVAQAVPENADHFKRNVGVGQTQVSEMLPV